MSTTIERIDPDCADWCLYHAEHAQRYEYFQFAYRDKDVLDAACGVGYGSQMIARFGCRSVMGIDRDPDAVAKATRQFSHPAARYQVHDCMCIAQLPAQFDVVVSFETIEHLPNPHAFLSGIHTLLRSNGLLICSTPNPASHSLRVGRPINNPHHLGELSLEQFRAALRHAGFRIVSEWHQSPHFAYREVVRQQQTLAAIRNAWQSSWAYRAEAFLRNLASRPPLQIPVIVPLDTTHTTGGYAIEPLDRAEDWQKTFIAMAERE